MCQTILRMVVGWRWVGTAITLSLLLCGFLVAVGRISVSEAGGVVGNGAPGSCTSSALSNRLQGGGLVTFNCPASNSTITLGEAQIINKDTVIDGDGTITLSGGGAIRLFQVLNGATLTLKKITITDGYSVESDGGAIRVEAGGSLIVEDSTIQKSRLPINQLGGGAIGTALSGTPANVSIVRSIIAGNEAAFGGGVYNGGRLTIVDSQIISNVARQQGGGLHNAIAGADATVRRTMILSNSDAFSSAQAICVQPPTPGTGGVIPPFGGGGVFNAGILSLLEQSVVAANRASDGAGLVNNSTGRLIIDNGRVAANLARELSGGISNYGSLTVTATTVMSNTGEQSGAGGVSNCDPGVATVSGSLIAANDAGTGGVRNTGRISVVNSTVANNVGAQVGGFTNEGLTSPQASLRYVTLAHNRSTSALASSLKAATGQVTLDGTMLVSKFSGPNCTGAVAGLTINPSRSLESPGSTCGTGSTVLPILGALQDNGGPTHSLALLQPQATGPACDPQAPTTDQRGALRPGNTTCDIGAYDFGARPTATSHAPATLPVGAPGAELTVIGTGFIPGTIALLDGKALPTIVRSESQIVISIPASALTAAGSLTLTLRYGQAADSLSDLIVVPVDIGAGSARTVYLPLNLAAAHQAWQVDEVPSAENRVPRR